MRLAQRLAVLLFAVSVSGGQPTRASGDTTPAKDKKPPTNPQSAPKKGDTPTTFAGQVVKVSSDASNGGRIWVKHANGHIDTFPVLASTKIVGAPAFRAITKGSMVVVESTKKGAVSINVSKLAPPNAPDKTQGGPVTGTVVKVHSDAYGDSGNLSVKTAAGAVKDFQVTNATIVRHPKHPDFIHSFQFVLLGDTVTVEHDSGKIALHIDVTATVSK
jgi:hypothetical protein